MPVIRTSRAADGVSHGALRVGVGVGTFRGLLSTRLAPPDDPPQPSRRRACMCPPHGPRPEGLAPGVSCSEALGQGGRCGRRGGQAAGTAGAAPQLKRAGVGPLHAYSIFERRDGAGDAVNAPWQAVMVVCGQRQRRWAARHWHRRRGRWRHRRACAWCLPKHSAEGCDESKG